MASLVARTHARSAWVALIPLVGFAVAACSGRSEPGRDIERSAGPLVQASQGGTAGAADGAVTDAGAESASSAPTAVCQRIHDRLGNCPGRLPMKISCGAGAAVPHVCMTSGEDYFTAPISTWCCPAGTSLDASPMTSSGVSCTCGAGSACACSGSMHIADSSATALVHARVYVDWWGWGSPPDDPQGEIPQWEDFLKNLGGSRWLGAVTQYYDPATLNYIQNPTDLWAGEWFGSTNPLPAGKTPCTQNADCTNTSCDLAAGHCYCATDNDCDSDSGHPHCNASSGLCFPTSAQFETEVDSAVAHFNPIDDGIILVAMPPAIPWPGYMSHSSFPRSGHPRIAFAQAAYNPPMTAGVEHEIAEAMTNPRSAEHTAWVGPCNCEVSDRCSPPPPGQTAKDILKVGESATGDYLVAGMWSNNRNVLAGGQCVNAQITNEDYFFEDCSWNLRHMNWQSFGWGSSDNFGQPLGGLESQAGAVSYAHDAVDAFALSSGDVWHMYWRPPNSPGWSDWGKPSGYDILYSPDAFSWRPQRIDVIAVGQSQSDGTYHLFHRYYENGTYSGWVDWWDFGITVSSRAAAAAWNVNRADVFVIDHGGYVWHGWSTDGNTIGGWSDWGRPAGVTFLDLDVDSRADSQVEVFAVGNDGSLWNKGYDHGSYYGWYNLGHPPWDYVQFAGAVGGGDGFTNVVSAGYTYLWQRSWDGRFSDWAEDPSYPCGNGVDISAW